MLHRVIRNHLDQLCRYVLRPPLAENRLRCLADDRVRLELKRPWSDGTTYLLFEPVEFLEKLAALTPLPEINLVLYHGVLAHTHVGGRRSSSTTARRGTGREISARGSEERPGPVTGRGLCRCAAPSTWTFCAVRAAPGGCS